jgi:hypothetical protein
MYLRTRSPFSWLIGLVVTVGLLIFAGTKIKSALNQANQVQAQANHLSVLANGGAGSSFLITRNFKRELDGVRARIGPHAPMIQVQLGRTAVEFQYAEGQRAAGLTANTVQPQLVPEQVTLDGNESVRKQSFSLSVVRAAVPVALVTAIRRRPGLSDFSVDSLTLAKDPLNGKLVWTVTGTGGGRSLVFLASPIGRGLHTVG